MAAQHLVSQAVAEAPLPSQTHLSPSKQLPWWSWVVIVMAWIGILFVLTMLFAAVLQRPRVAGFHVLTAHITS
jgi:hypothetical protein